MYKPSGFTVVIDANVFFSSFLGNLILYIAESDLFSVKWTNEIHHEWISARIKKTASKIPTITEAELENLREKLERRRDVYNQEFDDSLVTGYEYLIDKLELKDPDDRHVLAAAIHGKADAIVTSNVEDFAEEEIDKYGIQVVDPGRFILDQITLNEEAEELVAQAIVSHKKSMTVSKPTWKDYFEHMARINALNAVYPHIISNGFRLLLKDVIVNKNYWD